MYGLSFSDLFPMLNLAMPTWMAWSFRKIYLCTRHVNVANITKYATHSDNTAQGLIRFCYFLDLGFPGGLSVKNLPANTGHVGVVGLTPGLGRSLGGGNGCPLQYSCLGNPMDRGAWWATVHGVTKSQMQLSDRAHVHHQNSWQYFQEN